MSFISVLLRTSNYLGMPILRQIVFGLSILCIQPAVSAELSAIFPTIQVSANNKTYQLEHANTFERRAQGLMQRKSMCQDCGMLFEFQRPKLASFWMKDTLIPLDIAFITAAGVITDIKPMQPLDLNTTNSSKAVIYAWEMNQGWFAKNGIKVGDKVVVKH